MSIKQTVPTAILNQMTESTLNASLRDFFFKIKIKH